MLHKRISMLSAVRAAGWLTLCSCAGVSGCVSDELLKVVLAQNVALTAAGAVQSFLAGLTIAT